MQLDVAATYSTSAVDKEIGAGHLDLSLWYYVFLFHVFLVIRMCDDHPCLGDPFCVVKGLLGHSINLELP